MMTMTITRLRADIYKIIDNIIATGKIVEVERNGHIIKIVPEAPKSKLANLTEHPGTIVGDANDLVHMDWLNEWDAAKNL